MIHMDSPPEERTLVMWLQKRFHNWFKDREKPIFCTISFYLPFVAVPTVIASFFVIPKQEQHGHPSFPDFGVQVGIILSSIVIGTIAGLIALRRGERNRILAWAGLVLNGSPLLFLFYLILRSKLQ
jgi:hypothetical protein